MPVNGFDIEGLRFELRDPKSIYGYERWKCLKDLAQKGFRQSLPNRTKEEVDHLLSAQSVDIFRESRQRPTRAARRSDHMRSSWFYSPTMTIAYDGSHPVGYAFAAHNISGNPFEALAKRLITRSYVNIRELVVDPEYQGNGIAETLGYLSVANQGSALPVTAYVYDENEGIGSALIGLGMDEYTDPSTGYDMPEAINAFGPDTQPAMMRRFEGPIHLVKDTIMSRVGADLAIAHALDSVEQSRATQ